MAVAAALRNDPVAPAYTGTLTVQLFASRDGTTRPDSAVQLAQTVARLRLKPGAVKAVRLAGAIAAQVPEGDYVLVALVTGAGVDPAHVTATGPTLRVEGPVVNLTPAVGAVPAGRPGRAGRPFAFSIPLRNDGNVDAKGATGATPPFGLTADSAPLAKPTTALRTPQITGFRRERSACCSPRQGYALPARQSGTPCGPARPHPANDGPQTLEAGKGNRAASAIHGFQLHAPN